MGNWYRAEVKKAATPLIAKWEPVLGVKVDRLFVPAAFGSTPKPAPCLEYIVVHEMAHLIVRGVVQSRVTRGAGLTLPGRMMAP